MILTKYGFSRKIVINVNILKLQTNLSSINRVHTRRYKDRQTDRQTDGRTDGQTDTTKLIVAFRSHMQRRQKRAIQEIEEQI